MNRTAQHYDKTGSFSVSDFYGPHLLNLITPYAEVTIGALLFWNGKHQNRLQLLILVTSQFCIFPFLIQILQIFLFKLKKKSIMLMFNLVTFYSLLHGPKVIIPSVWVPVPLFSWKNKIALFLCFSKSWFLSPSSPTLPLLPSSPHFLHICSLVSHEINVLVPLFPQTPGRASVFEDTRKERSKRTIGLPFLKLLARSTANNE